MECAGNRWVADREYIEEFGRRTARLRIPLSGSIDLTNRCNLRCVHCYAGPQSSVSGSVGTGMETQRLLSLVNEITEAGCLFLVFTGGEPLMRPDFAEIYRHSKSKGLLVTVFTNATLITDEVMRLFDDLPPHTVEISIYGASAGTYERITGVKGSYGRCVEGIRMLTKRRIDVRLKTVLMNLNEHELSAMEEMAAEYGARFRFDAAIFPRFNGDRAPLDLRVTPEEAVRKEMSNSERLREWREFFERFRDSGAPDTLYKCGAGLTSFHIDASGNLMPCLMSTAHKFSLSQDSFMSVWNSAVARVREEKAEVDFVCNKCENQIVCGYCPAFFGLENGAENVPSAYLCAMGGQRFQMIQDNGAKENRYERR